MARTAIPADSRDTTRTDGREAVGPVSGEAGPAPCWPRSVPAVLIWD